MYVLIGILVSFAVIAAPVSLAITSVAYPLETLTTVYGNAEAISQGVADGSMKGMETEAYVSDKISGLQNEEPESQLQNLMNLYSAVNELPEQVKPSTTR